jgi:hypothetical protein
MGGGMTGDRKRVICGISVCGVLLVLTPALAAAQDQVPPPRMPDIVTIRSAGGTIDLKGTTSADLFEFTHQCESRQGISASTVSLTLPFELEGGPDGSLEQATTLLREAVAKGFLMKVEADEAVEDEKRPAQVMIQWGTLPEFEGVLESVSVKYTMFSDKGFPVRATSSVKFKEADRLSFKKGGSKEADKSDTKKKSDCSPKQQ